MSTPMIRITIDNSAFTAEQFAKGRENYPVLDLQIEYEVKRYIQDNDGLLADRYLVVLEPDSEDEGSVIIEVIGVGAVVADPLKRGFDA